MIRGLGLVASVLSQLTGAAFAQDGATKQPPAIQAPDDPDEAPPAKVPAAKAPPAAASATRPPSATAPATSAPDVAAPAAAAPDTAAPATAPDAAAATAKAPEAGTPAAVVGETKGATPKGETSADHRVGKRFDLLAGFGSSVLPLPSVGLAAGVYATPDLMVEASYDRGALSLWFIKAYADTLELRARKFWGNSFHTTVGLGRRAIGAAFSPSSLVGSSVLDSSAEVDELTLDTTLGNMWQWQHFTFGVDWVGVQWPLARVGGHDDFPDSLVSDWARSKKRQLYDDVAGGRSYSLLRFYFGASF